MTPTVRHPSASPGRKAAAGAKKGGMPSLRVRLTILLVLVAATTGGYGLWRSLRPRILRQDEYRVTPERVVITPLPDWIRTDLKTEVLREAGMEQSQSLLDPLLTQRIARAFELHPWVAQVKRVSKRHPARVEVELVYRRPVCMVEVPGGLYPVDAEGVLLPTADFSPIEARHYPRLGGVTSAPLGGVGSPWGDPRVQDGARIAEVLADIWNELKLAQIVPHGSGENTPSLSEPLYDLVTRGGNRIVWGHPPGQAVGNEAGTEAKIAWLRKLVSDHGSLDSAIGSGGVDLRDTPGTGQAKRADERGASAIR